MKRTTILGGTATFLLVASALAHAGAGWTELSRTLAAEGVTADTRGSVAAGWLFGSVAMGVFAGILARTTIQSRRGPVDSVPSLLIGAAYLGFGLAGFWLRGGRTHYLGFVVVGILVAAFGGCAWADAVRRAPRA